MERAGIGGAVTEERDRDALLAAHLEGERRADDPGKPAADDRVRAEVPDLDVVEVHRAAVAAAAAFGLPVQLGHDPLDRSSLRDRVAVRAMGRRDDVLARERSADAGRGGLLADRDMEESRQLTRAKAILHLLLEPADEEHLPEEAAQDFFGDASPPGFGALFDGRHRAAIMLIRRWQPPISGRGSRRALDPDWAELRLAFTPEGAFAEAAAVLGPLQPVRVGDELRFHVTRSDGGAERARNTLSRLDRKRVWGTLALIDVAAGDAPAAIDDRRRPRALGARRRMGRRDLVSCRPTGATCSASSSSTRATTSRAPRSSARR